MLPRLVFSEQAAPLTNQFVVQLKQQGFQGDINHDAGTRLLNATDNSVYQIMPQAILAPHCKMDIESIFKLASQEMFYPLSFTARGGGTGTNGQALNSGFIIDCSKYMNHIVELNLAEGWVKVEPGVVLDQLNDYLKSHGVFFAPTVSPSNRATLGGMTNTDACGKGSRLYGKTSHHILAITAVYSDGSTHTSETIDAKTLRQLKQQSGFIGAIYRQVDDTVCRCQEKISRQFPKLTRFMTGYDLAHVYSQDRQFFNLNAILVGSEGTLAVVTELKLKLTPIPKYKSLLVLQYDSFDNALHHANQLLESNPQAIETIDGTILQLAKTDVIYNLVQEYLAHPKTQAINLVEFVGNEQSFVVDQTNQLLAQTHSLALTIQLAKNAIDSANLWNLRKKSVGLLGKVKGKRKPISGVEDTAVPPEKLADYIKEFRALLDAKNLQYGMFGHVDAGCLHVRPALDLTDPNDEAIYHELSDAVAELTKKYGGLMWGEHGKGFRSQYVPFFFGPELYQELRKIKQAFDPYNQLNPGKIASPFELENKIVTITAKKRGHFDRRITDDLRVKYESPLSCNGNGACFNYQQAEIMCPSYKVTRDRRHSPKGRTSLLREWLRLLSLHNKTARNFSFRWLNTLRRNIGQYDFSNEVYTAMQGCLGCKACATQCPVNIDIPSSKAKFLQTYYTRYLRPWRDHVIAHSEQLAYWQAKLSWVWPLFFSLPLSAHIIKVFFRLVDTPQPSTPNLATHCKKLQIPYTTLDELATLPSTNKTVVLVQDWLTSYYQSELVVSYYQLLSRLGYQVYLLPWFANGKPFHATGYLKRFGATAKKNASLLRAIAQLGIPMIGIDPSVTLTYRQEYAEILAELGFTVYLIQEWLSQQVIPTISITTSDHYLLFMHCSELSSSHLLAQQWQQVFAKFGLQLSIANTGCCGMAGSYGHELEHQKTSYQLYRMSWENLVKKQQVVLSTGFSCRSQIQRIEGKKSLHPVEFLLKNFHT